MTEADKADLKRLGADKTFLRFLYDTMLSAGLFTVAPLEGRSLDFVEGRRSLMLDMLQKLEEAQGNPSGDGIPLFTSIQMFVNAAHLDAKEKPLGRRSDLYRDLGDGDGGSE